MVSISWWSLVPLPIMLTILVHILSKRRMHVATGLLIALTFLGFAILASNYPMTKTEPSGGIMTNQISFSALLAGAVAWIPYGKPWIRYLAAILMAEFVLWSVAWVS